MQIAPPVSEGLRYTSTIVPETKTIVTSEWGVEFNVIPTAFLEGQAKEAKKASNTLMATTWFHLD